MKSISLIHYLCLLCTFPYNNCKIHRAFSVDPFPDANLFVSNVELTNKYESVTLCNLYNYYHYIQYKIIFVKRMISKSEKGNTKFKFYNISNSKAENEFPWNVIYLQYTILHEPLHYHSNNFDKGEGVLCRTQLALRFWFIRVSFSMQTNLSSNTFRTMSLTFNFRLSAKMSRK